MRAASHLKGHCADFRKVRPLMHRIAVGAHDGTIAAIAALVAYLPLQLLNVKQGFWSAIAAIAVVQSELQSTESTAWDQFLGAAVGGIVGLCATRLPGKYIMVYAAALFVSRITCWMLNMASASRLAGITVTIILLVPHTDESAWGAMLTRVSTVAWGVGVAVVTVWMAARLPTVRTSTSTSRSG